MKSEILDWHHYDYIPARPDDYDAIRQRRIDAIRAIHKSMRVMIAPAPHRYEYQFLRDQIKRDADKANQQQLKAAYAANLPF